MQYLALTLSDAALYALLGLGITLVLGLTGLVNFAQADLMAVGSFGGYLVSARLGAPPVVGVLVGIIAVAVLAVILERGLFQFTSRVPISGFLVSLGLILIIENVLTWLVGAGAEQSWPLVSGNLPIFNEQISWEQTLTVTVVLVVVGATHLLFQRTRWGLSIRAMAVDRETASSLGVNVTRNVVSIFLLSGAITGLAGALVFGLFPIYATMGSDYILFGFAVAILGGAGSVGGALIASLVIAGAETLLIAIGQSGWESIAGFGIMILVLIFRPTGLARVA